MKAISLWQPWASFVAAGLKRFETRSWPTKHRGPLLITATKYVPTEIVRSLARSDPWFAKCLREVGTLDSLPLGAAIAIVDLLDCRPAELLGRADIGADNSLGDFTAGRFAWKLDVLQVLPAPIPLRGHQGFFEVPWISWHVTPGQVAFDNLTAR